MTVLALARFRAALDPGAVAFDWPTFTPHPEPPYDWRREGIR